MKTEADPGDPIAFFDRAFLSFLARDVYSPARATSCARDAAAALEVRNAKLAELGLLGTFGSPRHPEAARVADQEF